MTESEMKDLTRHTTDQVIAAIGRSLGLICCDLHAFEFSCRVAVSRRARQAWVIVNEAKGVPS